MRPLKIAFDGRSLASPVLRGWDRYTVGLLRGLSARGHDLTLFHLRDQPPRPEYLAGIDISFEPIQARFGIQWEQHAVPRALKTGGFDLYHAPAERGVPFRAACPVVLTYHSATAHSYRRLIRSGELPGTMTDYLGCDSRQSGRHWRAVYHRMTTRRAAQVLVPSEFCRREMIELVGIPADKVTTTPLAVHHHFESPPSSPLRRQQVFQHYGIQQPYLLSVGGYERHKNVSGLLQCFGHMQKSRPDLQLVMVGSTGPGYLLAEAEHSGLQLGTHVVFLDGLGEELVVLYDAAELFITLSWRETFCLPALEAITRGTPVIASCWGATAEVVGEAGALVDPRRPDEAARQALAILERSDDPALHDAIKRAASRYSWDETVRLTEEVYRRSITAHMGGAVPQVAVRA